MWPIDLMVESLNLADALDYLHNRLFHTSSISLAHNDIKPENVLVFYPDSTDPDVKCPVGVWKFADFGLSRIKDKKASMRLSPEWARKPISPKLEVTHRRTRSVSNTTPKRDPGRFTAPENHQETVTKTGGREADVWSFGCMLSEILAYAMDLNYRHVKGFRKELGRGSDDWRFYDVNTKCVKPTFSEYLKGLKDKRGRILERDGDTIDRCVDLINEIVVADPNNRLEANEIRDELRDIGNGMRSEFKLHVNTAIAESSNEPSPANSSATESPEEFSDHPDGTNPFANHQRTITPTITISEHSHDIVDGRNHNLFQTAIATIADDSGEPSLTNWSASERSISGNLDNSQSFPDP